MTTTVEIEEFIAETRDGRAVWVQAETINQAAIAAAHKLYPNQRNLSIWRTSGEPTLSGWFQAYVPIGHEGGVTSYGDPFHVR